MCIRDSRVQLDSGGGQHSDPQPIQVGTGDALGCLRDVPERSISVATETTIPPGSSSALASARRAGADSRSEPLAYQWAVWESATTLTTGACRLEPAHFPARSPPSSGRGDLGGSRR